MQYTHPTSSVVGCGRPASSAGCLEGKGKEQHGLGEEATMIAAVSSHSGTGQDKKTALQVPHAGVMEGNASPR